MGLGGNIVQIIQINSMLPPISIDLSDVIGEFTLQPEEAKALGQYVLSSVCDNYVRRWEEEIDSSLHSARAEYKKGIFQESPDENTVVLGLSPRFSKMSLMLEEGASAFDIKEGMANSPNRHLGKNGKWYITVPFKFATSEALAESMSFSGKLPRPIEKLVKVPSKPLQMDQIPTQYKALGENKTSGYTHKFNIYEGLQRQEIGSGKKEVRGGYINFRRISINSDKGSWQHPGFEALHLMDKAIEGIDVGDIVDHAIDEFLANRD
jgi:hypothetical protein